MRIAATQTGHLQPTYGEVREAYNLFWNKLKRPLPPGPPRGNQAHHWPPEQVEYVPGATVPAILLLVPNGLKATLRPGRARGNLWMLPPPTGRPFSPPQLVARQADGHPHHLLEMWAPSAGHCVAPPPVTGALPPHANGPRYPGTTPVATHALRTGRGEGHGHSGVGPRRQGGMEIPPGNVGHQSPGRHLPGPGQTPQRHAGGPRLPG